jgi:hypothetical protein
MQADTLGHSLDTMPDVISGRSDFAMEVTR